MVILMVPLIGIHSYISVVQARSGWEIRAEARFEFAKFVERLHKEIELKDPQKFIEYKLSLVASLPIAYSSKSELALFSVPMMDI